jgi:hypothetical protein
MIVLHVHIITKPFSIRNMLLFCCYYYCNIIIGFTVNTIFLHKNTFLPYITSFPVRTGLSVVWILQLSVPVFLVSVWLCVVACVRFCSWSLCGVYTFPFKGWVPNTLGQKGTTPLTKQTQTSLPEVSTGQIKQYTVRMTRVRRLKKEVLFRDKATLRIVIIYWPYVPRSITGEGKVVPLQAWSG